LAKRKEVGEGELTVSEHGRASVSEGEGGEGFISPHVAGAPIYN
jgi:hypothetical protein